MKRLSILAALTLLALASCAPPQVEKGRLFCAKATASGPLVIALADALGAPLVVTNQSAATVAGWCALIGGIPVVPPPVPSAAPVVAAPVAPGLAGGGK